MFVRSVHTSHTCHFHDMWKWKSARPTNSKKAGYATGVVSTEFYPGSFRAFKPQTVIIALIWCKWEGISHNQTGHSEIQSTIQKFNICRWSLFLGANSLGILVVQDVMDSNLGLIESFPCACEMICLILKQGQGFRPLVEHTYPK